MSPKNAWAGPWWEVFCLHCGTAFEINKHDPNPRLCINCSWQSESFWERRRRPKRVEEVPPEQVYTCLYCGNRWWLIPDSFYAYHVRHAPEHRDYCPEHQSAQYELSVQRREAALREAFNTIPEDRLRALIREELLKLARAYREQRATGPDR